VEEENLKLLDCNAIASRSKGRVHDLQPNEGLGKNYALKNNDGKFLTLESS